MKRVLLTIKLELEKENEICPNRFCNVDSLLLYSAAINDGLSPVTLFLNPYSKCNIQCEFLCKVITKTSHQMML